MAENQTSFSDRLKRIEDTRATGGIFSRRRTRPVETSLVVHPDGYVQQVNATGKRLRFAFPFKGVVLAGVLMVLTKAYLIWALGDEVYGAAVLQLLNGNQLERAAGLVLAPDQVSNWLVDVYQEIYRYFAAG